MLFKVNKTLLSNLNNIKTILITILLSVDRDFYTYNITFVMTCKIKDHNAICNMGNINFFTNSIVISSQYVLFKKGVIFFFNWVRNLIRNMIRFSWVFSTRGSSIPYMNYITLGMLTCPSLRIALKNLGGNCLHTLVEVNIT